jgi:anthranilate phosphoribosyltransferase
MNQNRSEAGERFRKRLIVTAKGRHGAKNMTRQEAKDALDFLFSAEAHPAQVGAFLTAMRFKAATVDEMMGFLDAMEGAATLVAPKVDGLLNCNGPYDGRKRALNLGVAAAIVTSAAGVPVMLHSNTGLPPKDGVTNARVLEALGIAAAREPELVEQDIEQKSFGHLHASRYLHGVERLRPIRQMLFYRSFLHSCEVMLNPAGAKRSLLGAAHDTFIERFAQAAGQRDQDRVVVVQGLDGGDELPLAPTPVADYQGGALSRYTLAPTDFGLKEARHHPCESPAETARRTEAALSGNDDTHLDAILFNSAVRIQVAGKTSTVEDGLKLARETIGNGKAIDKLRELRG